MKKIKNPLTDLLAMPTASLLSIYCTAGFPQRNDTGRIIHALQSAGVDMIEIGIPFSDPLADGPTIQKSNMTALNNGMTVDFLFEQLEATAFTIPIILMGYFNPILQFGVEKFCERCAAIGVSGLIIPDLPLEYYVSRYKSIFEKFELSNICLVTPQTDESRIRYIDEHCTGFIYAVSSSSTTGSKSTLDGIDSYLQKLKAMKLRNPILTGFNIHDSATFHRASRYTRGAIIGSAFIREISNAENLKQTIISFVKKIRS